MADNESIDLNEGVTVVVEDSTVITTPIDDTLSISGDAADAKAVGDALAQKADLSQIVSIKVNGQSPDQQGEILVNGTEIPMSGTDDTTLKAAIEAAAGRTGATIPVNGEPGAASIEQAIANAAGSLMSVTDSTLALTGEITDSSDHVEAVKVGTTKLPVRDSGAVRSVNNVTPGTGGNVQISTVDAARQLVSENTQLVEGEFIRRTSGGSTSIGTGAAYLGVIRGNCVHTGYEAESFTATVTSSAAEPITAEVTNKATFRTQAEEGGTYTFTYTGSWDKDPATWGVTVEGTPTSGDVITVVWAEEERGTITPAAPSAFVGSNWNLYNSVTGYARVIKYSEEYGFGISGAFTALKFSETLNGTQTAITPVNGIFTVPSDGYVWVTGGNATSTAIWMQFSDWTENYEGSFAAHSEGTISLGAVMTEFFPNGLCAVGDVRDEINLNTQEAIVRIQRLEYSAENLADVISDGRAYEADEDYIYAVYLDADMPDPEDIDVDGSYNADDHGMEWFEDTAVPVYTQVIYGDNLVDKLRTDVLTKSQDLIDNLVTNDGSKALSAKQGKLLKDSLDTASKVSAVSSPVSWTSAVTSANCEATMYKMGKLRMLVLGIYVKNAISSFTQLGTISSGNRPPIDIVAVGTQQGSSQEAHAVQIRSNGQIRMSKANASSNVSTMYYVTLVYMVA